ncbi:MAG: hypothetical protein ABI130_06970 [Leifsonia sp.]
MDTPQEPEDTTPTTPLPTAETEDLSGATPATAAPAHDEPTFFRRHAVALSIVGAALAVVLVSAGTAWGVSAAVTNTQSAPVPAATAMAHSGKSGASHKPKAAAQGVRGTITAMNGENWTLTSQAGTAVTVTLDSSTQFGSAKAPATASSFAVGDKIGALGPRTGDTVAAKRIVLLPAKAGTSNTPMPTPTPGMTS